MADGLAKHELNIVFKGAKKALGELNLEEQVRQAVLVYLRIRESGEDQDPARKTLREELLSSHRKKTEEQIDSLYQTALPIGEKLWHEAFMEFYY